MNEEILIVQRHETVAHVQLNRPEVMNALNQALIDEIFRVFGELNRDPHVRTIVLSGSDRGFCAGGDVSFLKVINSQSQTGIRTLLGEIFHKLTILARVEKPVVAALHGVALGAGFALALLCDMRFAAQNTVLGIEFAKMGIIPEIGCTHILPNLVGPGKAMELVLTARRFDAEEAERVGLINRVYPEDRLLAEVMDLARGMAALPPLALGMSKTAIRKGVCGTLEQSCQLEADINALCYSSDDHKEAAAAFFEKREPVFKGR